MQVTPLKPVGGYFRYGTTLCKIGGNLDAFDAVGEKISKLTINQLTEEVNRLVSVLSGGFQLEAESVHAIAWGVVLLCKSMKKEEAKNKESEKSENNRN